MRAAARFQPVGMGALERFQKRRLLPRREVANLEDDVEMRGRDGNGIGGVGDLRNETAVFAERVGEALARAGGAALQHFAQQRLVRLDACSARVARRRFVVHAAGADKSSWAILCLTKSITAGATESVRRPVRSNSSSIRGSPPASPQRLTLRRFAAPCATTPAISRSTAGCAGS